MYVSIFTVLPVVHGSSAHASICMHAGKRNANGNAGNGSIGTGSMAGCMHAASTRYSNVLRYCHY